MPNESTHTEEKTMTLEPTNLAERTRKAFHWGVDFGTDYYGKGCLSTPVRDRGYNEFNRKEKENMKKTYNAPQTPQAPDPMMRPLHEVFEKLFDEAFTKAKAKADRAMLIYLSWVLPLSIAAGLGLAWVLTRLFPIPALS